MHVTCSISNNAGNLPYIKQCTCHKGKGKGTDEQICYRYVENKHAVRKPEKHYIFDIALDNVVL